MKKMFALFLVLVLALSLVACQDAATEERGEERGEEGGEEGGEEVSFAPETAEEFLETVLENFNSRTEHHRRSEEFPNNETKGNVLDLYYSNIGTDELTLSGTLKIKESGAENALYGEGNTVAKGPHLATSNVANYVVMDAEPQVPQYLSSIGVDLRILPGHMEENMLNGTVEDFLKNATLTENEDGSYTLTVPLEIDEVYQFGGFARKSEAIDFRFPCEITYTADKTGVLTSLSFTREWKEKETVLHTDFSYETSTHKKPSWFNKEDPWSSEGVKPSITHETAEGHRIRLTKSDVLTVSLYRGTGGYEITLPDYVPAEVYYSSTDELGTVIAEEWTPETKIDRRTGAKFYFKKGTRPAEWTSHDVAFEGEWEMRNGKPVKKMG